MVLFSSYFFMELIHQILLQLDEHGKIVKVEFFFDRGELLGGLLKGASFDSSSKEAALACPFLRNTG